ncbi:MULTISPECIES: hypothetical protein [unclassified Corallococcus]|uniref:hypothetical protein n=1 Tax=unclassified Corallococcus TaxID=2685029 RepID=UPI001A8C135D|nr:MULTISPECIES: hypothetical protein [unclassified Corallococcus]MBN9687109.1 hypothetical protein [Corallococcus sp. NCSPR001]WAS89063.1 hypothetical protein O0N60_19275 [Corallococcus sp. NCRR]
MSNESQMKENRQEWLRRARDELRADLELCRRLESDPKVPGGPDALAVARVVAGLSVQEYLMAARSVGIELPTAEERVKEIERETAAQVHISQLMSKR